MTEQNLDNKRMRKNFLDKIKEMTGNSFFKKGGY